LIGFHTDVPACDVVLLVSGTARNADLVLYPLAERSDPGELEPSRRTQGAPNGVRALSVAARAALVVVGRRVPHETQQASRGGTLVRASVCYAGRGRTP
jgi:hypothetical protein